MTTLCVNRRFVSRKKAPSPQELTRRLEESMRKSPIRTDRDAARKFLAQLSMYDENGQLKKEY